MALTICACRALWLFGDAEDQLPAAVLVAGSQASNRAIQAIDGWGGRLIGIADRTEADTDKQVTGTLQRVDVALLSADRRTGDALEVVRSGVFGITSQVDTANATVDRQLTAVIGRIDAQREDLAATLKPLRESAQQVNEALPYILDCDPSHAGGDCLPNKYLEITHDAENALHAVSNAAPKIAGDVTRIADDATREADALTKPQSTASLIRTWMLFAARMAALL